MLAAYQGRSDKPSFLFPTSTLLELVLNYILLCGPGLLVY